VRKQLSALLLGCVALTASACGNNGSSGHKIGGTVSGLTGTLVLLDNGGDALTLTQNGAFTFATEVASGAAYLVTVSSEPAAETCTVTGGSGTVGAGNVTSVAVACASSSKYSVGGTITGLTESGLVLKDNGGDALTVASGATTFTFATQLATGSAYSVTDSADPSGVVCTVANGNGTIESANITNVAISCGPPPALPPAPQVVSLGGQTLAAPKVQLIVYAEDTTDSDVEAMVNEFTQGATWGEQTAEYGVGAATVLAPISIPGTPPTSLDDNTGTVTPFQTTLASNLTGSSPAWGAPSQSTIYAFLLPKGTDINSGGHCCTDFLGYHYEAPVASSSVPYAVICHCPAQTGDPLTELQTVTTTVSHELVESATDPLVTSAPAYYQTDNNNIIWTFATGGEIADMCEYNADSNYTPPGATYMVQRSWSNHAAAQGNNPCVPVPPSGPYFNSVPILTDNIDLGNAQSPSPTVGVTIPIGQTKVVDIELVSQGTTSGPWTVTAYDLNDYLGNTANTTLALDKTSGNNGDILRLTITVHSAANNLGMNGEGFVLVSDLGAQENISMGAIGN